MKKNIFLATMAASLFFTVSCTQSNNSSSSKVEASVKSLKDCSFDVLVFANYRDRAGKMKFDFEKLDSWYPEGTHDYAVKSKNKVASAHVEILKKSKKLKKIALVLDVVGETFTHLNHSGLITQYIKGMGDKKVGASMRFVLTTKDKKTCKKDIEIFTD